MPFGVLLDSLLGDKIELPICITAHFRNFPESELIRFKGIDSLRFVFMNSLKEANTLKSTSAKDIINLSTKETNQLLDIVFNPFRRFKDYWEINRRWLDQQLELDSKIKFPVKFVFNSTDTVLCKTYSPDEKGTDLSLGDFIRNSFSEETNQHILTKSRILCLGIEFDLNTPIAYIYLNFSCLDNILYIAVI